MDVNMSLPLPALTSLYPAASQCSADACPDYHDSDAVKEALLRMCMDLLILDSKSDFSNASATKKPDPYTVSLHTLYERLCAGKPCPIPLTLQTSTNTNTTSHSGALPSSPHIISKQQQHKANRPLDDVHLAELEDIYYATLAKTQETYNMICVRLRHGFTTLTSRIFGSEGGPTLDTVLGRLEYYWAVLNSAPFIKTLDAAVRQGRVKSVHAQVLEGLKAGVITEEEAKKRIEELYKPGKNGEYDVQGLAWIGGWAPCMIGAWLEEKYRVLLRGEKEMALEEARERRKREREERRRLKEEMERREREKEEMRRDIEMKRKLVQQYWFAMRKTVGPELRGLSEQVWTVYGKAR
jgi:hypothetical protein